MSLLLLEKYLQLLEKPVSQGRPAEEELLQRTERKTKSKGRLMVLCRTKDKQMSRLTIRNLERLFQQLTPRDKSLKIQRRRRRGTDLKRSHVRRVLRRRTEVSPTL